MARPMREILADLKLMDTELGRIASPDYYFGKDSFEESYADALKRVCADMGDYAVGMVLLFKDDRQGLVKCLRRRLIGEPIELCDIPATSPAEGSHW